MVRVLVRVVRFTRYVLYKTIPVFGNFSKPRHSRAFAFKIPFDSKKMHQAAFDEMLRIIREEEPPRPSAKLSGLSEGAVKAAQNRRTEVKTLAKRLHKELEWIPLKAMRKEPDRRYKTASELADDVRNYLDGDPLMAGPEAAAYRFRKFARKRRGPIAAVAAVLVTLIVGIVFSTGFGIWAQGERQRAVGSVDFLTSHSAYVVSIRSDHGPYFS